MDFLRRLFTSALASSLETATPEQAVQHLLPMTAYQTRGFDQGLLKIADAARSRLMAFSAEERLCALLQGMEHKEWHVRAACADLLMHWRDPRVLTTMRQHINDPDENVRSLASTHMEIYGS